MLFVYWRLEKLRQTVRDRGFYRRRRQIASYGDSSLDFEFAYYVNGADYSKYMDILQAIILAIFETFEREKIEFAYPSQTLFVNKAN